MKEQTTTHNIAQESKAVTLRANVIRYVLRLLKWGLWLMFSLGLLMLAIDFGTGYIVREAIYHDAAQIPKREYAVVLGTAKYYPSGSPNLYYKYRLEAAKQLFNRQKVHYLLMSGDNRTAYYNEPKMMTNDLLKMGVPAQNIKQDYAGFSTLDSIIRADKVFQLEPFVIISQQFHCERALLIAKFRRIDAICYVAKYPDSHYKVRIREFFARTGMALNLLIGADATTLEPSQIIEPTRK